MDKTEITSHDQKGGITAKEVNIGKPASSAEDSSKSIPNWVRWLVAIATIIVGAITIMECFI